MSVYKNVIIACILLALIGGSLTPAFAQSDDSHFFPETRHWVRGQFWTYYQSVEGAVFLFGYPYTREFIDKNTGRLVQYFQKVRLELIETPNGLVVQVSPLGELMYDSTENAPPSFPISPSSCRRFETTGKLVCQDFLDYYNANNGPVLLGDPISNLEVLPDQRYVQYFRNGRLEWNGNLTQGRRTKMSDLGRMYYDEVVGNPQYTQPEDPGDNIIASPWHASAYVEKILISKDQFQTIYVSVTNQYNQPISDALVEAAIILPDGNPQAIRMPNTDSKGISKLLFKIGEIPPNSRITVEITVTALGQKAIAPTWFRIWW